MGHSQQFGALNKLARKLAPLLIVLLAVGIYLWRSPGDRPYTEQRFTLDSSVTVQIYGMPDDEAENAAAAAYAEMDRIGKTAYGETPDDLVRKRHITDNADEVFGFSQETAEHKIVGEVIAKSLYYTKLTNGAFDPTIGAISALWSVGERKSPPSDAQIREALADSGFQDQVVVSTMAGPIGDTVPKIFGIRLKKDSRLDLGGVAKGYAIDRASGVLKQHGVKSALISAVSSTSSIGEKPDGKAWTVGVENPRRGKGPQIIAELKLPPGANVSTSGDYQKFFMSGGRRYHHIFNPKTGRPAAGVMSVTVVSDLPAADTDVLSTALFVMGPEKGAAFLKRHRSKFARTGALFVDSRGKISATPGLSRYLTKREDDIGYH